MLITLFKKVSMLALSVLFMMFIMFTYNWYYHAENIQAKVRDSFVEYEIKFVRWEEAKTGHQEVTREHLMDSALGLNMVFGLEFDRKEKYEYLDSIYDMNAVLINEPDNFVLLAESLSEIILRYDAWAARLDRFNDSRFLAMMYTF